MPPPPGAAAVHVPRWLPPRTPPLLRTLQASRCWARKPIPPRQPLGRSPLSAATPPYGCRRCRGAPAPCTRQVSRPLTLPSPRASPPGPEALWPRTSQVRLQRRHSRRPTRAVAKHKLGMGMLACTTARHRKGNTAARPYAARRDSPRRIRQRCITYTHLPTIQGSLPTDACASLHVLCWVWLAVAEQCWARLWPASGRPGRAWRWATRPTSLTATAQPAR